ncbi:hypothetical protein OIV83_003159 [Microbotryomycetes sp. JL201]|nr:hypothetical protein OIV83_003159 [Microbotryomycetes sp. JL201]
MLGSSAPNKRRSSPTDAAATSGDEDDPQLESTSRVERRVHDNTSANQVSEHNQSCRLEFRRNCLEQQGNDGIAKNHQRHDEPLALAESRPATAKRQKRQRVKRKEMPDIWAQSLENVLEDHPGIEATMTIEGMLDPVYMIRPHHVRQLLALCLDPTTCGFTRQKTSKQSLDDFYQDASDPLVETVDKVRMTSRKTLQHVAHVNGPRCLFRSIRGHGYVKDELDEQRQQQLDGPESVWDDPVEVEDEQDESKIAHAGRTVKNRKDVWELLQAGVADKLSRPKLGQQEDLLCLGGWDLLDTLCSIWEREMQERIHEGSVAPTFLSTLEFADENTESRSATASGDNSRAGTRANTVEATETTEATGAMDSEPDRTFERQRISMRLLALVGSHVQSGHIEHSATSRLLIGLKELSVDNLATALEQLPRDPSLFSIRLLELFLDKSTHPSGSESKPKPSQTGLPLSPRKSGLLGRTTSFVDSGSNGKATVLSARKLAPGLWRDYDRLLSDYLSRFPLEAPIKLIVAAELEREPSSTVVTPGKVQTELVPVVDLTISSSPSLAQLASGDGSSSPLPSLPALLHREPTMIKSELDLTELVIDSDPASSSTPPRITPGSPRQPISNFGTSRQAYERPTYENDSWVSSKIVKFRQSS